MNEVEWELRWQAIAAIGSRAQFKDIVILDSLPKLRGSFGNLVQPVQEKMNAKFVQPFLWW